MSAGKFHDWRGLIDDLEINKPFNTLDYGKIIVVKFETASTPLPPKDESKYEPTVTVLASSQNIFTSGLREALQDVKESHRFDVEQADTEKTAGSLQRTLLVRGKVNEMNPGSKALRYWVSFGAGQSRVEIEGDVVDAASGSVLVKFKHARSSGIGVWGGDYFKFLSDDTHDIGEDVRLDVGEAAVCAGVVNDLACRSLDRFADDVDAGLLIVILDLKVFEGRDGT